MTDIQLAMVVIVGAGVGAFFAAMALARSLPRWAAVVFAGLVLAGLLLFKFLLQDSAAIARLIPVSNVVVVGNWLPIFAGALAGATWPLVPAGKVRRALLIVPLAAAAVFEMYRPFRAEVPRVRDLWEGNVCIQSSGASCSPAAAATLLRHYGIDATETEMVDLCLTRVDGTNFHGLYRGLKLKTLGTRWDVEAFQTDIEELRRFVEAGPVILNVRLPRSIDEDSVYVKQWGWVPGQGHTVVLFGFGAHNKVLIADPAVGLEAWDVSSLYVLWHGQGLRLVRFGGGDQ